PMLLKTAQVTNFKIVEDSGEFSVDRVTCLVGKNESGKTALLEALYRLNPYYADANKFDKVLEYPRRSLIEYDERHPKQPAKVVDTTWEFEPADVDKVEAVLGAGCLASTEIRVYKSYDSDRQIWTVSVDEQ